MKHKIKIYNLLMVMFFTSLTCTAESADTPERFISLRAEDAPIERPWERGATIAYSSVNGKSAAIIDAEFNIAYNNPVSKVDGVLKKGVVTSTPAIGAYWHRNTGSSAPRDDRGISFLYLGSYFPDSASGAVQAFGWSAQAKFGSSLAAVEDTNDQTTNVRSNRQIVRGTYYLQPMIKGIPIAGRPAPITFFGTDLGLYSDHIGGGNSGALSGRISGVLGKVSASYAPFGLVAQESSVGGGILGFVPILVVSAQVQRDFNASGERLRETRKLYDISLNLSFGPRSLSGISQVLVPSLTISRTIGSDALIGQYRRQAMTNIALSFLF